MSSNDSGGQDRIDVKDDSVFGHTNAQMTGVVGDFDGGLQTTARSSASPGAAGTMPEGADFMTQERQSRELLAQYMTKTSDGLHGYQSAVGQLDNEHRKLVTLNTSRLRKLMQPHDGEMPNDAAFNWRNVLAQQSGGK